MAKKKKVKNIKQDPATLKKDSTAVKQQSSDKTFFIAGAIGLFVAWAVFLWSWVGYLFWQSDTYWLIEVGRLILEKHALPSHDIYSFTSTATQWVVYQWLTEVVFELAHMAAGLTGVAIFGEVMLAILCCLLIFRRLLKEGANPIIAVATIWFAAYAFFPSLSSLRPQLFSFLFFWLLVEVCADLKADAKLYKSLLKTFLIGVLWANCHISFLVGLLILVANFIGSVPVYLFNLFTRKSPNKNLPALFAASIVVFYIATFLTPYGPGLWLFVSDVHKLFFTQEVMPIVWQERPHLLILVLLTFVSAIYGRKKTDPGTFLALIGLILVGAGCGRLIVYFCLFSCPVIAFALTELLKTYLKLDSFNKLSAAVETVAGNKFYPPATILLAALVVLCQPLPIRTNVPVAASKYIAENPLKGNLFCSAHAGSYLIYSLHGAVPVFADTRVDLYSEDFVFNHIKAMYQADNWKEIFARYKIANVLLPNDPHMDLVKVLQTQSDWKTLYKDNDFTLFTKK